MALFVQIDHFRKTDQKPTVKNHLFSISWFRSFNRTSFQQQLKHEETSELTYALRGFNRTSFQQQLKHLKGEVKNRRGPCFNRTSFQQQLKQSKSRVLNHRCSLQSYILSTTTETWYCGILKLKGMLLQSYILSTTTETTHNHGPTPDK